MLSGYEDVLESLADYLKENGPFDGLHLGHKLVGLHILSSRCLGCRT